MREVRSWCCLDGAIMHFMEERDDDDDGKIKVGMGIFFGSIRSQSTNSGGLLSASRIFFLPLDGNDFLQNILAPCDYWEWGHLFFG